MDWATLQACLVDRITDNPAICDEMAIDKCVRELSSTIPGDDTSIRSRVLSTWQTAAFFASNYSGWNNTWRTRREDSAKSQGILLWCSGKPPPEVCNLPAEEVEGWPAEWYATIPSHEDDYVGDWTAAAAAANTVKLMNVRVPYQG